VSPGGFLSKGSNHFVLLLFAVKERRAEGVEVALLCQAGCFVKPPCIAEDAPLALPESGLPQETLQIIILADDQLHFQVAGNRVQRFQSPRKFLVGLNIGIEEESVDEPTGVLE
jgi:hypothetical protein